MKLNKMTGHALKIIHTFQYEQSPLITSTALAQKADISETSSMKVLRRLMQHGIIQSHRGRGGDYGGYSLAVESGKVTLLDIIEIMEGTIDISKCLHEDDNLKESYHHLENELQRINDNIKAELSRFTLKDILEHFSNTL